MQFSDVVALLGHGGMGNTLLLVIAWLGKIVIGKITGIHKIFTEKLVQEKINTDLLRDLSASLHKQTFLAQQNHEELKKLSERIIDLSYDTRELSLHVTARPKKKIVVVNGANKVQ